MIDTVVTVAQIVSAVGIATICAAAFAHVLTIPAPTWEEEEPILCGECSLDMGDYFDAWPDALQDIDPADRVQCAQCGQ